jgi:hypothetical protein
MNSPSTERARWVVVVAYAAAMAWIESASVYYLRLLVDRVQPYQPDPLPMVGALGNVELVREAATLVMLFTTGMLAGRTWQLRIGYMAIAFGAWDILYYVFLRIMSGWPTSLLDWDILFLLPLPWWGPVLAPMSIAVLMIAWGTLSTQWPDRPAAAELTRPLWISSAIGIALALGVFMSDALTALPNGRDAVTRVLPASFNWPLFAVALLLMATPVSTVGWRTLGHTLPRPWIRRPGVRRLS